MKNYWMRFEKLLMIGSMTTIQGIPIRANNARKNTASDISGKCLGP
jgi:hypothetical protein